MTALLLRQWRPSDIDVLIEIFADASMRGQFTDYGDETVNAETWLKTATANFRPAAGYFFCVVENDDRPLANVACFPIDSHSCGWISYWTAPQARGRGISSSTLAALVPWLHDEAGVERLELGHRLNNPASGAVAVKAGFTHEGVQRGKLSYDGVRYDTALYGRLSADPRVSVTAEVTFAEKPQ